VKIRLRFFTVGTLLMILAAMLTYPSAASAAPSKDAGKASTSAMKAAPGVRMIWKKKDGGIAKVQDIGDISCANTGTCIVCEVAAIQPWQDSVSPIINFRGEVYCYQPDQGYRPAAVGDITMQVGLWDLLRGTYVKLSYPPQQASWVSQLGLTDAAPIPGCGVYETDVIVSIYFPECCPISAYGGFSSYPVRLPAGCG
jgi:hypothetical protein